MKRIVYPFVLLLLTVACSDDLSNIGGSLQPDSDKLTLNIDSAFVSVDAVKVDSIYSKTIYPLLGGYTDASFGIVEADFLTEFYCADGFRLHEKIMNEGRIDSAFIRISYPSFIGDKYTPQQLTVYRLEKNLPRHYYSNVSPEDYFNPLTSQKLGSATYSGVDLTMSDSIRALTTYYPSVRIPLTREFLDSFADQLRRSPSTFDDSRAFRQWFKGIYVKNSYGRGTLLQVGAVDLMLFFKYGIELENKPDSIAIGYRSMPMTREVVQLTRYSTAGVNSGIEGPQFTYIKSPGGHFARVKFPLRETIQKHKGEVANNVSYSFNISRIKNTTLKPPQYMLFIPKEEYEAGFFEESNLPASTTSSYLAAYDTVNYRYSFKNIAPVLNKALKKYENVELSTVPESIDYYLIPVAVTITTDYNGNSTIDRVTHLYSPSALRIKKIEVPKALNPFLPFGHRFDMIFSKSAN